MPGNKAVAYIEPGKVEVQTIDYPKLELKDGPGGLSAGPFPADKPLPISLPNALKLAGAQAIDIALAAPRA